MSEQCAECKAYHGHAPECSRTTREQLLAAMDSQTKAFQQERQRNHDSWIRLQERLVFWKGKFVMVKHENNQLRRKLRKQEAK